MAEASRTYDLTPSEIEDWVEDDCKGMENALRANPLGRYKRSTGARPRIEALPSVATAPNERWSTDLARVWTGKDKWATIALVMDCHTRELLGWHISRSGKASTATSALEHALIARFGTLGRVETPFLLRNDNGLVFKSRKYTALVKSYGLKQEFITPHCLQQNGMMERLIRSLKELSVVR